jgi:hypothetical protein
MWLWMITILLLEFATSLSQATAGSAAKPSADFAICPSTLGRRLAHTGRSLIMH